MPGDVRIVHPRGHPAERLGGGRFRSREPHRFSLHASRSPEAFPPDTELLGRVTSQRGVGLQEWDSNQADAPNGSDGSREQPRSGVPNWCPSVKIQGLISSRRLA